MTVEFEATSYIFIWNRFDTNEDRDVAVKGG